MLARWQHLAGSTNCLSFHDFVLFFVRSMNAGRFSLYHLGFVCFFLSFHCFVHLFRAVVSLVRSVLGTACLCTISVVFFRCIFYQIVIKTSLVKSTDFSG